MICYILYDLILSYLSDLMSPPTHILILPQPHWPPTKHMLPLKRLQQGGARWREVRWGEEGDCMEGQVWLLFQGHPEHLRALMLISRTLLRRWQAFSVMSCPTWLGETEKDPVWLFWAQKPLCAPHFLFVVLTKNESVNIRKKWKF